MTQKSADNYPRVCEDIREKVGLGKHAVPKDSWRILKRDSNFLRSEAGRKPWEERYAERMSCFERGLMVPSGLPFKDLGAQVDAKALGIEAVIEALPTELQEWYQENYVRYISTADEEKDRSVAEDYEDVDMGTPFRFRTAGMSIIQEAIDESAERLFSAMCGQPYLEQLEKIKKRKQREAEIRAELAAQLPVVRKLSLGTLARKLHNRDLYSDTELAGGKGEEEGEEDEEEEEEERSRKEGSNLADCRVELYTPQKFFAKKLNCIILILSSLHNMRKRHLKSRVPLKAEVVLKLRRFPFKEETTSTTQKNIFPKAEVVKAEVKEAAPPEVREVIQSTTSLASVESSLSAFSTFSASQASIGTDDSTIRITVPSSTGTPATKQKHVRVLENYKTSDGLRMEVWEDLLRTDVDKKKAGKQSKYRPLWQVMAKDPKDNTADDDQHSKRLYRVKGSKNRSLSTVLHIREVLAGDREKLHQMAAREVEQHDGYRLEKFRLINQNLYIGNEIPERFFPRMRKLLDRKQGEYTTEWFRSLKSEAKKLNVQDTDETFSLMKKLRFFIDYQVVDRPNFREKMCLLVLSFSADEVCLPAWQSALIFVMVDILKWKLKVLKYWLSKRHLFILQHFDDEEN